MHEFRGDFRQRHEHKPTLMQPWMRDYQCRRPIDQTTSVKENIKVHSAWIDAAAPLSLKRFALNSHELSEQIIRGQTAFQTQHRIEKIIGCTHPNRLCVIKRGKRRDL